MISAITALWKVAGRVSRPPKKMPIRMNAIDHVTEAPAASHTPFACTAVNSTLSAAATPAKASTSPTALRARKRSRLSIQLATVEIAGQR